MRRLFYTLIVVMLSVGSLNAEEDINLRMCNDGRASSCSSVASVSDDLNIKKEYYNKAFALYKEACDKEEGYACVELGAMYEDGDGVAIDIEQAYALYKKGNDIIFNACRNGGMEQCEQLGYHYLIGKNIKKDIGQAEKYYVKACNGGLNFACEFLANMYYKGEDLQQDYDKAEQYASITCDADDRECKTLGLIYEKKGGIKNISFKIKQFFLDDGNIAVIIVLILSGGFLFIIGKLFNFLDKKTKITDKNKVRTSQMKNTNPSDILAVDAINFLSKKSDTDTDILTEYNTKTSQDSTRNSPFQQALQYSKKPAIGVIIVGVITAFGGGLGAAVPLMAAMYAGLVFVIFPILWLSLHLKDKGTINSTMNTLKGTAAKASDSISAHQSRKSIHDNADTILKYHEMLEKGIITQEKFDEVKDELMNKS